MSHPLNNANQVRFVLRDAIQKGVYPGGSTLPSTRQLAEQFGINRNTATKIYHELAREELVELSANRPPVVSPPADPEDRDTLRDDLRQAIHRLFQDTRLVAMSPDEAHRFVSDVIDEHFLTPVDRPVFVAECNEDEAHWFAQELTLRLGRTIRPILIDQLDQNLASELVFTPYFHLREARTALGNGSQKVVGLVVTADGSDIVRVASMVTRGPLGVVAINSEAADRLGNLLSFQINVPMITATTESPGSIDAMRDQVECIVCTPRAYQIARSHLPGSPVTMVQYQIDRESLDLARLEIERLRAGTQ